MARRWTVLPAAAMVTCFTSGWLLQQEVADGGNVYQQARLFETVMAYVRDYHVDSIGEPELYRRAADGLLANLHDPYAALLSGKDLEKHVAPAIRAHLRNALECMKTRARPVADIEQGHISSSACILANVALTLGRTLEWDQAKGQVVGDDEANRLLRRPYRSPWVHPEPSDFA